MLTLPRIDQRDQQQVAEQVRELLLKHCGREWTDQKSIMEDENADAVIQVFSRMMEIIIQRLNKVPDKNFLTFLDLVGTRLSPPRVARAPLTFTMAKGKTVYGKIPKGTQVATVQTKELPALVFETESDITVIQPGLIRAISLAPEDEKWTDHSKALFDGSNEELELFEGEELVPHRLYMGHGKLFSFKEQKTITLDTTIVQPDDSLAQIPQEWEVKWYYFDETLSPKPLNVKTSLDTTGNSDNNVVNLLASGSVTFEPVAGISEKEITGFEKDKNLQKSWKSHWIFAELKAPVPEGKLPEIKSITASIDKKISSNTSSGTSRSATSTDSSGSDTSIDTSGSAVSTGSAFFNSIPLDLTKDFYPFGERPKFNDTFYIGSKEVFSKEGANITIGIILSGGVDRPTTESINLSVEFWDGKGWKQIGVMHKEVNEEAMNNIEQTDASFTDTTTAFTQTGDITFTCPKIELKEENGVEDYWVRVRIIGGNYGTDAAYETTNTSTIDGSGTISSNANNTIVTGNGTKFQNELRIGDSIIADTPEQTRIVTGITGQNSLSVNLAFNPPLSAKSFKYKYGWIYKPPTYKPPSISELTLKYDIGNIPLSILSYNDFTYQNHSYLFNWNEVPKNNARLIESFIWNFNMSWIREAKIEKIADKDTINISDGKNFLSLVLDAAKNKVYMTVNGIQTDEFVVIFVVISGEDNIFVYNGIKYPFVPFQHVKDKEPAFYLAFDKDVSGLPVTLLFPLLENKFAAIIPLAFETPGPGLGATSVMLKEVSNLYAGDKVEFHNANNETETKTIIKIDEKTIFWEDGLNRDFRAPGSTIVAVIPLSFRSGPVKEATSIELEDASALQKGDVVEFSDSGGRSERKTISNIVNNTIYWEGGLTKDFGAGSKISAIIPLAFDSTDSIGPGLGATETALKQVSNLRTGDIVEFRNPSGETEKKTITSIINKTIYWEEGLTRDFSIAGSTISLALSDTPPVLAWEYWNGKGWTLLSVEDRTENLTKRELIQFYAPSDLIKKYCFGEEYSWIRARLDKGRYETLPKLKSIYTNTVWTSNLITVKEEILGSSNGKTDQVFNFSHFPVHSQKILVQELSLTAEEKQTIIDEENDKEAIEEIKDTAGYITGYWVRWHEVNHFFSSGPHSRHYIIDKNKGIITFGDGERGMIPPAGKNNIKCTYMYGGGKNGNYAGVNSITKLRTAFNFIESVTNHEAADGGGDKEELDRARERGPQTIKHRGRAVTFEDYEWLVRASPKIARVKCLQTTHPSKKFKPGWVTIIIVPDERENPKPIPTQGLIDEIKRDLFSKASSYLTESSQIALIGPGYIQVRVEAQVHFTSIAEAKIIEGKIIDDLNRFFHPLTGGPDGEGWNFGKGVHISEVYKVIEEIEGVDYVEELYLRANIQIYKLCLEQIFTPEVSYLKNSRVTTSDERIVFSLAEKIEENLGTRMLTVLGFKEGDQVTISNSRGEYITTVVVVSVSGNLLECEANIADITIPVNSIVETADGIKSYTTRESTQKQDKIILFTVEIFKGKDEIRLHHKEKPEMTKLMRLEQNYLLDLEKRSSPSVSYPENSMVTSIDGRIAFPLAQQLAAETSTLMVLWFKKGNDITVSDFDRTENQKLSLEVLSVSGDVLECNSNISNPNWAILETSAETSAKITTLILKQELTQNNSILFTVATFKAGDDAILIYRDKPDVKEQVKIKSSERPVTDIVETIYVEENYLVYSGTHSINKK